MVTRMPTGKDFKERVDSILAKIGENTKIDESAPSKIKILWPSVSKAVTSKMFEKNFRLWGAIYQKEVGPTLINSAHAAALKAGVPYTGEIASYAKEYYMDHGLSLVKGLTETDLMELQDEMINNWGIGEEAFADKFKDNYLFSEDRLQTIYRSEHHRAQSEGILKVGEYVGHEYKRWITAADERTCEICNGHADDVVPMDEAFEGGYEVPQDSHPNCYKDDVEVFTESGWKQFKYVDASEKIWTLDVKNGEPILDVQKSQIAYHYTGDIILIKSKTFDCAVTPDHEMLVVPKKEYLSGQITAYIKKPASELVSGDRIFRTAQWTGISPECINIMGRHFNAKDFMEFIGWYISEGSITIRGRGKPYIMISQMKDANRLEIFNLCKRMFNDVKLWKSGICIKDIDDIVEYFVNIGHADKKYIPEELRELSPKYLSIMFDSLIKGDGHIRKSKWNGHPEWNFGDEIVYATISEELVSNMTELALKLGYRPNFSVQIPKQVQHKNGVYTSKYILHVIRFNKYKYACITKKMISKIPYDGMVYCLEMKNNPVLYVRRNGKANWSGNCRCTLTTLSDEDLTDDDRAFLDERDPIMLDDLEPTSDNPFVGDEAAPIKEQERFKRNYKCKAGTVDEGYSCSAKQESDRMDKESKAYNEFDSKRRLGPTKIDFFKSPTTQKFVALQSKNRYALSGDKEDLALKGYLKESGADGLPKVVSKQKLDSLIAKGSIELWRGVDSKEAAKEFESGELQARRGVWGNGTYSATGPDAEKVADRFAIHVDQETGDETPGYKMRFTLDKSAKIINFSDLRKEQDQTALNLRTEADISPKPWEARSLADIMSDAGRYAAIRGYDAIRITKPEPFNSDHVIIINRTKVIMEKVDESRS